MGRGTIVGAVLLFAGLGLTASGQSLILTGVADGFCGDKCGAIELYVVDDIADLSEYDLILDVDHDGAGGDTFTFPADSATAGDFIYCTKQIDEKFLLFYGFLFGRLRWHR